MFVFVTTFGAKANQRETKPNKPEGKSFGLPCSRCFFVEPNDKCKLSHVLPYKMSSWVARYTTKK